MNSWCKGTLTPWKFISVISLKIIYIFLIISNIQQNSIICWRFVAAPIWGLWLWIRDYFFAPTEAPLICRQWYGKVLVEHFVHGDNHEVRQRVLIVTGLSERAYPDVPILELAPVSPPFALRHKALTFLEGLTHVIHTTSVTKFSQFFLGIQYMASNIGKVRIY